MELLNCRKVRQAVQSSPMSGRGRQGDRRVEEEREWGTDQITLRTSVDILRLLDQLSD